MNPVPDLRRANLIVINSSAGKDSQAMLDYVAQLADAAGVLDRCIVAHAGLGRMEWAGTGALAEAQAKHYGIPFHKVKRPQGDLLDQVRARGMWPSSTTRYCTSDQKRDQIAKIITRLATTGVVYNCLGLRARESTARAKREPFSVNKRLTNSSRTVYEWLPIHDWSVEQVWARIKASGVPHHPAYDLGMPRLSCVFCVFAPKNALILAGHHNRALLRECAQLEADIGHTFRKELSLAQVEAAVDSGAPVGPIQSWEM